MKKYNLVIFILLGGLLVCLYLLIVRKPKVIVEPFDDSELREQIRLKDSAATYWETNATQWQAIALDHEQRADSLEQVKTNIKYDYSKIYKLIPDGTTVVIDSIIWANI